MSDRKSVRPTDFMNENLCLYVNASPLWCVCAHGAFDSLVVVGKNVKQTHMVNRNTNPNSEVNAGTCNVEYKIVG